jgi:hypothetical protein
MADVPSYEVWMKQTYSLRHKRSPYLLIIDETIKNRQGNTKIKEALDRWRFDQSSKGKDWTKSVRNKKTAVTNLYRAVNNLDKRKLSDEEREAMKYLSRVQAMALSNQFDGKELTFKSSTLVGIAQGTGTKWQKFKTGATAAGSGAKTAHGVYKTAKTLHSAKKTGMAVAQATSSAATTADLKSKIMKLCKTLTPGLNADQVFKRLNLGSVEQFSGNVAPFMGAISSGKKMIVEWIGVARVVYRKYDTEDRRFAFAPGDPEAALNAVLELLIRERNSRLAKAGVATGAFGAKLGGAFADGGVVSGPIVGLLETLAEIMQMIVEYVRDWKEVQRANELLRIGYLNFEIFNVSPILGCYFLLIQDHSTIINFLVADYGTPNFVIDAEKLVKTINPVLDQARGYVDASKFEIAGFDGMKGLVDKNWSKQGIVGKVTGLPGHVADKLGTQISDWVLNPEKPPKLDKSRIVGIGWNGHSM